MNNTKKDFQATAEYGDDLLSGSQIHLDLALRSAGMGIFSYSIGSERIMFDDLAYKILGISSEKKYFERGEFLEMIHPKDRAEVSSLIYLSASKAKDFEAEYRILWKDGTLHYIVSRARIILRNGKPTSLSGLIWDITDQKTLEINLHENLRKINSIINNLNGVVFRCRLDNDMTMEFISQGVEAIAGYPSWNFKLNKVRSFHSLIYTTDKEKVINAINQSISLGCQYTVEYRIKSSDGNLKWLSERGHVVPGENDQYSVEGIITDITENKNMQTRLNRSLKQLQELNQYLHTVRERERVAISRELHDDLGQSLTAVKFDLLSLKNSIPDNKQAREKIGKIDSLVLSTIKSVQNITAQLRPQIIEDLGLEAAIEWYATDFSARTGIKINLLIEPVVNVPAETSLVIFRIMQESLTNIARHSQATKSGISLTVKKKSIILVVTDNGIGISEKALTSKKAFGLISMRERAKSLGGELKLSVHEDGGTEVTLLLPVKVRNNHESFDL